MPLRPSTRTWGDVKRAIRRTFGDEAAVQLDDADIQGWVNDAQTSIVSKNHALKAVAVAPSVVGQGNYTFPTPLINQIESILYDGVPLAPYDIAAAQSSIFGSDPQSEEQGTPTAWYEWAGEFVLYPKPDTVKDITLYYTRYPEPITGLDDAQLLDVSDQYYQAVLDFVLWKAYELDESWEAAQMKEAQFRTALEENSESEREAAHMLYPIIQDRGW